MNKLPPCFQLILIIIEILYFRVIIFLKVLPLWLLVFAIGLVDGLVQRDIRKFQGARESAFIFHRALLLLNFCFFVPLLIYFGMPLFISPVLFLAIQGIVLAVLARIAATYFKKYV